MNKHLFKATVALLAMFAGSAYADALLAVRVEGKDVAALAKFYQSAFGMHEVNRLQTPTAIEIMLNFGDTLEIAKANKSTQLVISQLKANELIDAIPHVVISVTDMPKTVAAFKAAGGKFENGEPQAYTINDRSFMIGFGTDPAGNKVEVILIPDRK